jgi:hypothetical protein
MSVVKVLELVHVQEEGAAGLRRAIRPAERGETDGRGNEADEHQGAVFAKLPLRQIDEQHPALVHKRAEAQRLLRRDQDAVEGRIGEKRAELVPYRRYGVRPHAEMIILELARPETPDGLVADVPHDPLPVLLIRIGDRGGP